MLLFSSIQVSVPFSTFIQSCKSYLGQMNAASDKLVDQGILEKPTCSREMCSSSSENSEQVYLAQASSFCTTRFRLSSSNAISSSLAWFV